MNTAPYEIEPERLPRAEIRMRFEQLKSKRPKARARDLASEIGPEAPLSNLPPEVLKYR